MSTLYWHSRERTAELRGFEFHWLRHLARGPAVAAWDLDAPFSDERVRAVVGLLADESPHADSLRELLASYHLATASPDRTRAHELLRRLVDTLRATLAVHGLTLDVGGYLLNTANVELNTALAAGSPPIQLAAKLSGYGERHAWVGGGHREWLARVIEAGLDAGLYREGLARRSREVNLAGDAASVTVEPTGWRDVIELLNERDDGPVVTSYSVGDGFPNPAVAGWTHDVDVDGEPDYDRWYALTNDERWQLAVTALRDRAPWLRLSPTCFVDYAFDLPITVYDLWAHDRDERVERVRLAEGR